MKKEALPLYLFSFFMIMPMHALFPLLPMIRDEFNASYSQISIFLASLGIVRLLLAYPSGILSDRFNKKQVLLFSGVLCMGGLLILSVAHSFYQLMLSRILIGFSSILCNITILSLLAQLAGSEKKGMMMSMNNVVHNAGGIVSPTLAGFLAKWFSWRVSFLAVTGLVLFSMVLVVALFKDRPTPKHQIKETGPTDPRIPLYKNTRFLFTRLVPVFSIGFFVFFYRGYFRHTIMPFFGKDVFQIEVDTLGIYFSLTAGIAMVSLWVMGYLSDRLGRKTVFLPSTFLCAVAALLLLLPPSLNPLLMCCIFVGLGAVINSMPNILISDLVPLHAFGRIMGFNRIFADSGYFLGTLFAGLLLDQFGFRIPVYCIAGYALATMLITGLTIPNRPTDFNQK